MYIQKKKIKIQQGYRTGLQDAPKIVFSFSIFLLHSLYQTVTKIWCRFRELFISSSSSQLLRFEVLIVIYILITNRNVYPDLSAFRKFRLELLIVEYRLDKVLRYDKVDRNLFI